MKREILFRGYGISSNEWVEGDLIHGVGAKSGNIYILPNKVNLACVKNCDPLDGVQVHPDSVGQFTGMCDMDGDKVFELMRVRLIQPYREYIVKFHEGGFHLFHPEDSYLPGMHWGSLARVSELGWQIQIIGNTFK